MDKNFTVKNAKIAFRNFSGKEGKFNPAGRRNFCLLLDADFAKVLVEDGWNVKTLTPRDPADSPQDYLQVSVSYANPQFIPKMVMITSGGKTMLEEDTISLLDWAEIENIDLVIRPYNWDVNKKKGVKAYVKSMYISLIEDELEKKYRDVPDSASSSEEIDVD
ncbi:MAG: hypothetical protein US15_C0010G0011 [Candidatus Moranbacteria bacterium GW2011_GWF1_36_4]|nr:MAG: hypothetical protein US15_C0010G0011 [Candidatus Moranbacteria bacterium GW2011_GWF1_36_4]HAQ03033.1 hypothetical protein [Candidatus Nomurabacteria bacterium]